MSKFYRPLPECLTIKTSEIEGLGLFAKKEIYEGTILGISHHVTKDEVLRTPLGGFYNHSENPNCIKRLLDNKYVLVTLKKILEGEEITVKYTLYKLS